MTVRDKACIAGAFEHPGRHLPDESVPRLLAEVAFGALDDAGLTLGDVDAFFCDSDAPGVGALSMTDYLGLQLSYFDTTESGGSAALAHVGHTAAAIAEGKCHVALIVTAGKGQLIGGGGPRHDLAAPPEKGFESVFGSYLSALYALGARRHMYEYGTTSEQLAEIKVAASSHARHNPNAVLPKLVTIDEVINSPMISDPLHRLDCCAITDGGGALVVVSPAVAKALGRRHVKVLGHGEAPKHTEGGRADVTTTGAVWSGPAAMAEAGITPADVDYASIYDSFTFTVLVALEDLGFCAKGEAGAFVSEGGLCAPSGRLPVNTDGGSLCNNHPGNRGGMVRIVEAVRQLREEAHPAVQVPDCKVALAHGTGGTIGSRMANVTLILGREDA